ncbi:hypothetical protein Raf01_87210 [Rugosimonospora africana]|uniref:Uncharacterized protein n=1 Tax=Rugosimonospora africana TaxID=556532 RepID=A0A8J3R2F7_9ACTN|nr:hypothetical protein Raf01_87210 [Rugosimonospora africana]
MLRRVIIAAGHDTGWHWHHGTVMDGSGRVYRVTTAGTACIPRDYPRGTFIKEPAGFGRVRIGITRGDGTGRAGGALHPASGGGAVGCGRRGRPRLPGADSVSD